MKFNLKQALFMLAVLAVLFTVCSRLLSTVFEQAAALSPAHYLIIFKPLLYTLNLDEMIDWTRGTEPPHHGQKLLLFAVALLGLGVQIFLGLCIIGFCVGMYDALGTHESPKEKEEVTDGSTTSEPEDADTQV